MDRTTLALIKLRLELEDPTGKTIQLVREGDKIGYVAIDKRNPVWVKTKK